MLNAPWWLMPGTMFLVNAWIKSRGDEGKLWLMKTEDEVKQIPVIVAAGQAEKGKDLPPAPGGYRWKEVVLTYSVSPFSAPSEVKVNVLEKWLNDAPKPGGAGYMDQYEQLQGFQWNGEVSPGAGAFLTAEYMAPGASPRGSASPLALLIPREQVLYAPATAPDFGVLGKGGGGGHHHHGGGGRRGGRGWGGGWGWGAPWGPLYAEDLPVIIVDGQEHKMTEAEWEAEKKRREEAKKKKALASFVDAESISSGAQFGQGPDDIEFNRMSMIEALAPNTYETDWKSFMGDVGKSVNKAFEAMKGELKARGLRLTQIPTNQAVVGDFVVTAECKLCTIAGNQQGGLVLREIHPNKGQLWHYVPGQDPPFACAFGIRR